MTAEIDAVVAEIAADTMTAMICSPIAEVAADHVATIIADLEMGRAPVETEAVIATICANLNARLRARVLRRSASPRSPLLILQTLCPSQRRSAA